MHDSADVVFTAVHTGMDDPGVRTALAAACISACVYAALYNVSRWLSPKLCPAYRSLDYATQADWNTRLPSTVHALVTVWLVAHAFLLSGDFTPSPGRLAPVLRTTPTTWTSVGFSLGYFAADTVMLALVPAISSTPMAVHHVIAVLSLGVAIQLSTMHLYLLSVLLTEITTPLVNLRFWLDQAHLKHLPLYTANGVAMFLLWGPFRVAHVIPFTRHVAANWQHVAALPWHGLSLILGVPVLLCALNGIWYIKIAKGAWKLVFGPARLPPSSSSGKRATTPPPPTAAAAAAGKAGGAAAGNRTVLVEAYSGRHSPEDHPHVE